jgi:hypothetical protein
MKSSVIIILFAALVVLASASPKMEKSDNGTGIYFASQVTNLQVTNYKLQIYKLQIYK